MQQGGFAKVQEYLNLYQRARDLISYTQEHLPPLLARYQQNLNEHISAAYWNLRGVLYILMHRVTSEEELPADLLGGFSLPLREDPYMSQTEEIPSLRAHAIDTPAQQKTEKNLTKPASDIHERQTEELSLEERLNQAYSEILVPQEYRASNIDALFTHRAYDSIIALIYSYKDSRRFNNALAIQEQCLALVKEDIASEGNQVFFQGLLKELHLLGGDIYYEMGMYEDAIFSYRENIEIAKKVEGEHVVDAYTTTQIAKSLMLLGLEREAYPLYRDMLEDLYLVQDNGLFQKHLDDTNEILHRSKLPFAPGMLMRFINASNAEKKKQLALYFQNDKTRAASFRHYADIYSRAMDRFREVNLSPAKVLADLQHLIAGGKPSPMAA